MNTRAALYGSLHLISIASHAVTKVLEPVHLRLFIAPEASCGFTQEQSCGQFGKPVTDLPLPKYVVVRRSRGGGRHTSPVSGRGPFFLDHAVSVDRVARGSKLSRPRSWEEKGEGFRTAQQGETACLASRLPSRKLCALKISKLYISPIEIAKKKPSEVDDELMIGRGSHSW